MTTDLLFMPKLPPKPPCTMRSDKTGAVASEPFSKNASTDSAKNAEPETFLTTLRKVSRDRNRSEGSHRQEATAAGRMDPTDRSPVDRPDRDNESVGDDAPSLYGGDEAPLGDEAQMAVNLSRLMALLEKLGLKISAGGERSLHGAQSAQDHMTSPAEKVLNRLAALKQLLGAIQSQELSPDKAMADGLERLGQVIARAMGAGPFHLDQSGPKAGINPGQENAPGITGAAVGEGASRQAQTDIPAALSRAASGTDNAPQSPEAVRAAANSQLPLSSDGPARETAAKLNPNIQAGAEAGVTAKDINAGPTPSDIGPEIGGEAEVAGKTGTSRSNGDLSRLLSAADKGHRSGGEPLQEPSQTGDSSPVSKLINDAQVAKENPLKADLAAAGDAGSKVVKLEAGTNDGGQLASQSQTFEKPLESTSSSKEAEAVPRELRPQTMEQIVRRAVIQVRDGQHEARIDLKPEFLGHVRMQVITANQQVTVKILTEFGFVKDMIENSVQQLKAELQQQGLEVDKVDVSVSRDSQGNKHPQENMEHAGNRRHRADANDSGNEREEQPELPKRFSRRAGGPATVDYFA